MQIIIAIGVFVVLLVVPFILLLIVVPRFTADENKREYRVVHFVLRLALTFGIGAVIVGILLVAALLWLRS